MKDNDLKGKIACELIIEATETKGKRPTQLNFEELIDVVESVVKKLTIPVVVGQSEQLKALLSKVVDEFDSGEVTWDTRDEIENVLKSL